MTDEGRYRFRYDARVYWTDRPSMTVGELLALVDGDPAYTFFETRNGEDIYYSHAQAVDLTREPWFFSTPPATMVVRT